MDYFKRAIIAPISLSKNWKQEILKEDLIFAHGSCLKNTEDSDIISKILFTNEATFNRCGIVNLHNSYVWADQNLLIQTNSQRQFSTNI